MLVFLNGNIQKLTVKEDKKEVKKCIYGSCSERDDHHLHERD